jgi:hypothetical protein
MVSFSPIDFLFTTPNPIPKIATNSEYNFLRALKKSLYYK